ncbi:MAG: type I toxin-antitoxin system SymE family toxin [Lachnospiraceae bacterium]|nr:type I toxin-antitoxin system SymE family toxin [Lachnospiraceae bacterium]
MKSKLIKVISSSRIIYPKNIFYDDTKYIRTPKIQIEGNWLEALGFHIGDRLQVDYEEGSIHIRLAPSEPECPTEPA